MTTKQVEDRIVTTRTVYVATDGREFDDKDECRKYERTFACAMKSYLKDLSIREAATEEDLFYTGSCETQVYVVIPKTKEDILHIKQIAIGLGASEQTASNWVNEEDIDKILIVTLGYADEWIYISRFENIIKNVVGEKYKLIPVAN